MNQKNKPMSLDNEFNTLKSIAALIASWIVAFLYLKLLVFIEQRHLFRDFIDGYDDFLFIITPLLIAVFSGFILEYKFNHSKSRASKMAIISPILLIIVLMIWAVSSGPYIGR